MKKTLIFLLISLVATALTDVTLYFQNPVLTFVTTAVVFFLAAFLFHDRIRERTALNSFLIFFFLIALMTMAYIVNPRAHVLWNFVVIASLFGYIAGTISKIVTGNKRIISLTLSLAIIFTCSLTVVSKIAADDKAKFDEEFNSGRKSE